MLKSALLMAAGVAIGFGASAVLAQNSTPYFQIAEINVVDQKGYEASGVVELRDAIKASGAKLIGGGYNKAVLMDGSTGGPVPNRVLIWMYPSKEVHDKVWAENIKPLQDKMVAAKQAELRAIGVQGVEMK